ncbi:YxeA family protein [Alkalicoccobacillus porphyridii]|uniref:YxeA family protein n=1 Tax=Alkalicoccobacillus porphyridii TaxID=2597270 RepID=A0A554A2M5_9BACI|nr:YxeA family protein [Alkalicoccobacillus porphyridii]TSB47947.1 YxeA family protein [Alkalicoccobacillus porphyridii]
MKKLLVSTLALLITVASLYFIFRETFDRFNPLIEEEFVYVEVHDEPTDDNGRFKYDLKGVNQDNKTKRVIFSTSARLEPGTFIRVLAKGTYSKEYKSINEDEMP